MSTSIENDTIERRQMKKQTIFLISFFVGVIVLVGFQFGIRSKLAVRPGVQTANVALSNAEGTVSVDFGDGKIISDKVSAQTAYDALGTLAQNKGIVIEVKEYDFGRIIEKVDEKKNSKEYAWMYFVNGKLGEVAADKYTISTGDKIEWRYTKIQN